MKFKNILKKVIKYVATPLALVCGIIGLYSIDSYAYTSDTFSHTLTYDKTENNIIYFDFINPIVSQPMCNYVLLINISSSSNTNTSLSGSSYLCDNNYNSAGQFGNFSFIDKSYNNIITIIGTSLQTTNRSASKYAVIINSTYSYSDIVNIDFVLRSDITTMYYLDTYVSNYQQQLAQLQEDYETLEGQYETLEGQYETLEGQYEDLQNEYNELEVAYDNLSLLTPFYKKNISSVYITCNGVAQTPSNDWDFTYYNGNTIQYDSRDFDYYQNIQTEHLNNIIYSYVFKETYTLDNYRIFTDLRHSLEETMNIEFYYNGVLTYQDYIVPDSDSALDNYITITPINFNKLVISFELDYSSLLNNHYYKLTTSNSFADGYSTGYAQAESMFNWKIDDLNNQINTLKDEVISQYNIGYQEGFALGSNDNNSLYGMVIRTL